MNRINLTRPHSRGGGAFHARASPVKYTTEICWTNKRPLVELISCVGVWHNLLEGLCMKIPLLSELPSLLLWPGQGNTLFIAFQPWYRRHTYFPLDSMLAPYKGFGVQGLTLDNPSIPEYSEYTINQRWVSPGLWAYLPQSTRQLLCCFRDHAGSFYGCQKNLRVHS